MSWCSGESFDGCLVFDECHKAKHFNPGKEQCSTKVALAVSMVQKMLPHSRVVYCSATGVSDVKNMVRLLALLSLLICRCTCIFIGIHGRSGSVGRRVAISKF